MHLSPMVAANDAPLGTAFTVSVDVKHGLTTGISAEQRSNTVRALANGNMGAADFGKFWDAEIARFALAIKASGAAKDALRMRLMLVATK